MSSVLKCKILHQNCHTISFLSNKKNSDERYESFNKKITKFM